MPTSAPKTSASPRRSATSATATVVPPDSASTSAGIPTLRRVAEPRHATFGANIDPAIRASTLRGVIRVVTASVLFIHPGTSVRRPAFAASIACATTTSAVMYVYSGTASVTPATAWNSVFVAPGQSASTPTPVDASSVASASEKESTNALVAAYVAMYGVGRNDPIEPRLTIVPRPRVTIAGA